MLFRYTVIAMLFLSTSVAAQTNGWLKTIEGNALSPNEGAGSFLPAKPGFALYFAKSGTIDEPYLVYVPKSYNPAKPVSMVVFLHGAILAMENFQYKDPSVADEPIFSIADPFNTIVVFPFGRSDFKWSGTSPAYENIIKIIGQTEANYNIDRKRVYIGGISMGGNATFWFVNNKAEIFAGFYTFSAMPRLREGTIHFANITRDRPLYSMNAKDDAGFSFEEVKKLYEQHKSEAPGWSLDAVETGGHRFIYGDDGIKHVKALMGKLLK